MKHLPNYCMISVIVTLLILTGCQIGSGPVASTPVAVTGITLNKSSTSIVVGTLEQLLATIEPANATNKNVTWTSSDPFLATITDDGLVYGDATTVATITVTTTDGGFTADCVVTVTDTPIAVSGVSLNKTSTSILAGYDEQLAVTFDPAIATNQNVTWSSDAESVATVSSNGLVSGVSTGFADITVESEDGGFTDTCTVSVSPFVNAYAVNLNKSSTSIDVGSTEQLTATLSPFDASNKNVTWSTSDREIATVSSDGTITAVAEGAATITVTTEDGGFTDTCSVTTSWVAGNSVSYSAGRLNFNMIYVTGDSFPTGTSDADVGTVSNPYWVGENEVTYQLWSTVYTWAVANGYNFQRAGTQGDGSGDETNQHPVTRVSWRDVMVWCNAVTEWYNDTRDTRYTCVYTDEPGATIRDSRDSNATTCDKALEETDRNGFRLLSKDEWELTARWRNDSTNTVSGYSNPYFTQGDSASGAYTFANDIADTNPANSVVDAKDSNDLVAVYGQYYIGYVGSTPTWEPTGVNGTAVVGTKAANALGIFDMSGNVNEWCFDLTTTPRVQMGGSWSDYASYLQIGWIGSASPDYMSTETGFRIGMTE